MLHPGKRAAAAAIASNALSAELDSHGTADAYWPSRRRRQRSRRLSWSSRNTPGYTLSESAGSNLAAVARAAVDGAASDQGCGGKGCVATTGQLGRQGRLGRRLGGRRHLWRR